MPWSGGLKASEWEETPVAPPTEDASLPGEGRLARARREQKKRDDEWKERGGADAGAALSVSSRVSMSATRFAKVFHALAFTMSQEASRLPIPNGNYVAVLKGVTPGLNSPLDSVGAILLLMLNLTPKGNNNSPPFGASCTVQPANAKDIGIRKEDVT